MKRRILIISNDGAAYHELYVRLKDTETDVVCACSFEEAIELFWTNEYSLVILDMIASEADSHKLLRMMRKARPIPILVLSTQEGEKNRTAIFNAGANAYIGKPYTLEECLAQAKSLMLLYTSLKPESENIRVFKFGGGLTINLTTRSVVLDGISLNLTRKEFDILFCLASHQGQVLNKEQLYSYVWDSETSFNVDEVVKAHIKTLRKKLSFTNIQYIETVWGVGYRFVQKKDGEL